MAKIKRGILGGISGRIGNVVGTSWKGIAVLKALPLSVANPNTTAQSNQRTKFKAVTLAAQLLLVGFVKPVWDRLSHQMSGFNNFVKQNLQAYSTAGVLDVTKFIASVATLKATAIASLSVTHDQAIVTAGWTDDSGQDQKEETDVAYLIAYNATQEIWAISAAGDVRSDESTTATFAANMVDDDVVSVWLCFVSANGLYRFKGGSDLSNTIQ